MMIELYCLACGSKFSAAGETPADDILDRMIEEGPWYAFALGRRLGKWSRRQSVAAAESFVRIAASR